MPGIIFFVYPQKTKSIVTVKISGNSWKELRDVERGVILHSFTQTRRKRTIFPEMLSLFFTGGTFETVMLGTIKQLHQC